MGEKVYKTYMKIVEETERTAKELIDTLDGFEGKCAREFSEIQRLEEEMNSESLRIKYPVNYLTKKRYIKEQINELGDIIAEKFDDEMSKLNSLDWKCSYDLTNILFSRDNNIVDLVNEVFVDLTLYDVYRENPISYDDIRGSLKTRISALKEFMKNKYSGKNLEILKKIAKIKDDNLLEILGEEEYNKLYGIVKDDENNEKTQGNDPNSLFNSQSKKGKNTPDNKLE